MFSSDTFKNIVAVLALVTAAAFALNRLVLPQLAWRAVFTDGDRQYDSLGFEGLRYAVWDEPREVEGEVNTDALETRPTLSPDGRWMVFQAGEQGLNSDLYVAEMVRGTPVDPRPLTLANSAADEIAPAFGPGTLYFASNRGGGAGGFDLYFADWRDGEVGAVRYVENGVNTPADECDPAPNGSLSGAYDLCFSSDRGDGGDFDLYGARWTETLDGGGEYEVVALEELNTGGEEREPAWTADGQILFFASDRDDVLGGFDLFRSRAQGDEWLEPSPLSSLNTAASERAPHPSADGFSLYYEVEPNESRFGRRGDLFQASSVELFRLPPRAPTWIDYLLLAALLVLALLAWLAKRWETLDILYKCLLLSILLHLLLLWYFRNVYPESEEYPIGPGREATFKVRMLSAGDSSARLRSRDGALQVAPSAAEITPELARADAESSQPDAPTEVAAREFERPMERNVAPQSEVGSAPDRTASNPERRVEVARAEQPALQAPSETIQRFDAQAAALAVDARDQNQERSTPSETAEAVRDASERAIARAERPVQSQVEGERELERRSDASPAPSAPAPAPVEAAPSTAVAEQALARAPAVAQPQETGLTQMSAPARSMSVSAATDFAPGTRAVEGTPARESAAPTSSEPLAAEAPQYELARSAEPTPEAPDRFSPMPAEQLERSERADSSGLEPSLRAPAESFVASSEAIPRMRDEDWASPSSFESAPANAEASTAEPERASTATPSSSSVENIEAPRWELARSAEPQRTEVAPSRMPVADLAPAAKAEESAPAPELRAPVEEGLVASSASSTPVEDAALEPTLFARAEPNDAADGQPQRRAVESLEPSAEAPVSEAPSWELARSSEPVRDEPARFEPTPIELLEPSGRTVSELEEPYLRALEEDVGALASAQSAEEEEPEEDLSEWASPSAFAKTAAEPMDPSPRRFSGGRMRVRSAAVASAFEPLATRAPDATQAQRDEIPERLDKTPYRSRFGVEKEVALKAYGGDEETERAVAAGLAYLAEHQRDEGHWGGPEDYHEKYRHVLVGNTGLALLAFLGAGHTQDSGSEYSRHVQRAIDFLLAIQRDENGHFGNTTSYSHGIATYALAECYALTQDPHLRRPIERAVAQILRHQYTSGGRRREGGWSYYYADNTIFDRWPRVSITSWQVMALESARLGGIEVPDEAFTAARRFLVNTWDERAGAFRYCHDPERLGSDYPILPASTPAALFALALLGEDVATEEYSQARAFIMQRAPRGYRFTGSDDFVFRARGNLYFWYYSSLAMLRVGGTTWSRWNAAMKDTLLDAQRRDGSWEPIDVYSEYAGDENNDAIYSTSINVLTLEVYYRYFTPLLQVR